jgi:predicted DNA-binding protein
MPRNSTHPRRRIGRPPAGAREGERVKDYPQLSIRLPLEAKSTLAALSVVTARPQWRLISDAIACYLSGRPEAERQLVADLVRRARPTPRRPPRQEDR